MMNIGPMTTILLLLLAVNTVVTITGLLILISWVQTIKNQIEFGNEAKALLKAVSGGQNDGKNTSSDY